MKKPINIDENIYYIGLKDAAEELGISYQALRYRISKGIVRAPHQDGVYSYRYYTRQDLNEKLAPLKEG